MLGAVEQQRQLTLEDEIDLLLALVRVDAHSLTRLEDHGVDPEAADAEFAAQPLQAVGGVGIERREGDIGLGH